MMKVTTAKIALLWFLIQCVLLRVGGQENVTLEWSAMLDLRFSLGLRAINWPLKGDPCITWTGVVCQNGRVVEINISGLKRTRIARLNPGFSVDSLANLTSLRSFNASSFSLAGSIPNWFGDKLNLLQVLDLRSCSVSGLVPRSLGNMSSLRQLYLSGNNLTGNIPSTLGNLRELSAMDLSNNMFYGTLPLLGNFALTLIDISTNYLQGNPPHVSGGGGRIIFILERNCLQGTVSQNQRTLKDCRVFYAERGLSFDDFGHTAKKSKKWIHVVAAGVVCGFCFIVVLVLAIVLVARKRRRGTTNQENLKGCSVTFSGESFTYEQLLNATGGFSETNLIKNGHSGDLFKGCLETGMPIVVKRIDLSCLEKKSYLIELDLLSKVVHTSRLVPLIGHSLEGKHEKLLVYKYMPNTDLANSLFRVVTSSDDGNALISLDWITRLKIAIGAAEALSYLHHECNPPLLHRDVQASSILLDDKFEVRLGSLSEVRPQDDHNKSHENVLTRCLHNQQLPSSSDPDNFASATTTAYDVYCFGKVLLELVTGKLGTSKTNDGPTKAWIDQTLHYISMHDKELVTNIVDPSLIIDEDLLEEVWAMAIVARSCVNPNSSQRPPMKYVHRALENPMKVVRQNSCSSSRRKIPTTSSRTASFFGNWRCTSLERGHAPNNGFGGEVASASRGSSKTEHSISGKRSSSEIFPEPLELQDMERQDQH